MGKADFWEPHTWNAVCSICGKKYKANDLERNWQGLYRCHECNEPRQPQDFVRSVPDVMSVPWAQKPLDSFVLTCSFNGSSAVPGYAVPDCMVPNRTAVLAPSEFGVPAAE